MTTSSPCLVARDRRRAFSLLEILVAVSLLVVIMVGLLAMFSQTQRAMRTGITQVDVMEGGRVALELISRELQELAPCKAELVTNFYAGINPAAKPLVMELTGAQGRTNELDEFFFLSRSATNLDEWVGIGYRVDNIAQGIGTLYRFVVPKPLNYRSLNLVNQPAREFALSPITDNRGVVNPQFHRMLDGVVHFRVLVYNARGEFYDPSVLSNPNIASFDPDVLLRGSFVSMKSKRVPAYVDIELGVLEPAVYRQYQEQPPALRQRFLEAKAGRVHVFRQRIPIRTGS